MKTVVKNLAISLLVGTAVANASYVEDYALTKEYKLLNDMKMAQKQQELILKMSRELETKKLNKKTLSAIEIKFEKVLNGLLNGDKNLNLKGTKLSHFRTKLVELKELWSEERELIKNSKTDKDTKDRAVANLNRVMLKMSELIDLYNKSYSRFKQKSKISSIVYRHMLESQKKHIAFNSVK
jgi:hypothetical protein